ALLAGPLRARLSPGTPFPRRQAVNFYLALLVFYVAVGSPLDQISERFLFSAHMLQHQILIYPAAILFLLGLPGWMVDPVLSKPGARPPLRILFHPLSCPLVSSVIMGVWPAPTLYDLALRNKLVHVAEHVLFFLAALIYWWPLLSPSRVLPRRSYGVQ